jgi:hypothetical protein
MRTALLNLLSNIGQPPRHFRLGTGVTAPSDKDVALEAAIFENAVYRIIIGASKVSYQLYVSTTQCNGYTIGEMGLYTGPPFAYSTGVYGNKYTPKASTMVARAIIDPFAKTVSDTMTITWDLPIVSVS